MKIYLGADHRGFELKETLKQWLAAKGYDVHDLGAHRLEPSDDYTDFAIAVAVRVQQNPREDRGILLCGSGVGMDVVANKHRGIRAALAHDEHEAVQSREHGDSNVLVLGTDDLDAARVEELVMRFLTTPFSEEERHVRRLRKITEVEEKNFKL